MKSSLAATVIVAVFLASHLKASEPQPAPRPLMAPWIVIKPGDPRLANLARLRPALPSPNSPGLLLDLSASDIATEAAALSAEQLVTNAEHAGWRSGLLIELQNVPVPTDARGAEVATPESLFPGLQRILERAQNANFFALYFPDLTGDLQARRFVLKKISAFVRALNPASTIAVILDQGPGQLVFPASAPGFKTEETAAFIDVLGFRSSGTTPSPALIREKADAIFFGRPLMVILPALNGPADLLDQGARFARISAPFTAAPLASAAVEDGLLIRAGGLLRGDFGLDSREADAVADGKQLAVTRFVSGTDLGGFVLITGFTNENVRHEGLLTLTLDSPSYVMAEVTELATGRLGRFEIPPSSSKPRLSLSTRNGPLMVKLVAREKPAAEAKSAKVGVTAERLITVEEILAKHQVWREQRDTRWQKFSATNRTSLRFRFAEANNTFELTLEGPFFFQAGKGYDWAWHQAYVNGVKWKGKSFPELPLVQPEKVSDLPLELTFNDAYRYVYKGQETISGISCFALDFEPRVTVSEQPLYAGRVFISRADYSVIRIQSRQLNLKGEIQSVDEISDFTVVEDRGDGVALRFPTRTRGQWILKTFSRTTVIERETFLENIRLDPQDFEEEKARALASRDVMVRDTEAGVRYLERTKEGERRVVDQPKTWQLFGLGGVFYDDSLDYPLPLLGAYYLDLDFRKKKEQVQVFFGGVLLAGSFNDPSLFGSKFDLGADVFGIAVRGTDTPYLDGNESLDQEVKSRTFAANFNLGYPIHRHVKLTVAAGTSFRDFAESDETSPDFAIPSDNWTTRLETRLAWDIKGFTLFGRYSWHFRSRWDPWGYPQNPDYDESKKNFRSYAVQLQKDFHLPRYQRIRSAISFNAVENADRFSKLSFGFFGSTSLRGFRSGSLRADQAFMFKAAYGLVVGKLFRLEGIYDHAIVKDTLAGLDWANFGGAGLSGQVPGPWSTIIQLDAGTPVVGRNRGQKGFVLNLVFHKIFLFGCSPAILCPWARGHLSPPRGWGGRARCPRSQERPPGETGKIIPGNRLMPQGGKETSRASEKACPDLCL